MYMSIKLEAENVHFQQIQPLNLMEGQAYETAQLKILLKKILKMLIKFSSKFL